MKMDNNMQLSTFIHINHSQTISDIVVSHLIPNCFQLLLFSKISYNLIPYYPHLDHFR